MDLKNELLKKITDRNATICVVGLGYVGLPLAVSFGKYFNTVGFDINAKRVEELNNGIDRTLETDEKELKEAAKLKCTADM